MMRTRSPTSLSRLATLSASVALAALLQNLSIHGAAPPGRSTILPEARTLGSSGRVAPGFVPNRGQAPNAVRYSTRLTGYTAVFTDRAAVFAFARHALRLQFVGASGPRRIDGYDPLPATVNYLVGSDRTRWRAGLPTYGGIVYRELWSGIDLTFRDVDNEIKYELTVSPGTSTDAARFEYRGAERLSVNADGDLVIDTPHGSLIDHRPRSYQTIDGKEVAVETRFVVDASTHRYGFAVGAYDDSRPLVIDPGLVYSTYLGGSGDDYPRAIAVDGSGATYVTGQTSSLDFPDDLAWVALLQESGMNVRGVSERFSDTGIFVTKVAPRGGLVYTTFLGSGEARAIAVQAGNIYVTGVAEPGTSLPATMNVGPTSATRAFIAKLVPHERPEGGEDANVVWVEGVGLAYSVMIGGTNLAEATGLAVDGAGNAHVVGRTESVDFPTTAGAFQPALGGSSDAFALAVNANGTALIYSTLLGGLGDDSAHGVAVDAGGNAHVAGTTQSGDFPTTPGAWSVTPLGGSDGFVIRLNATGSAAIYSTYLGGASHDRIGAITADAAGQAFVTGTTGSADFPVTAGAFQPAMNAAPDGFITRLDPAGSLVHSTFLGGNNADGLSGIALNPSGGLYVFGTSRSTDFPTTQAAVSRTLAGGVNDDAVLARFDASGMLRYATYLGGDGTESAGGLAIDARGDASVVGHVEANASFPTFPAVQAPPGVNGYLAQIIPRASLSFNKPATASSVESAELAAGNAVDGNLTTGWSSEPSDRQWITVDLGSSIVIERVWSRWGYPYATEFEIQVSDDGAPWTIVGSSSGSGALINDVTFSPVLARYVRIFALKRSTAERGYSLLELDVYPPLESVPSSPPNVPPSVSITSPTDGSTFTLNITFVNITFTADAADGDGTVERVEFLVNGSVTGYKTAAPYSGIWSATAPGTYTLTARAFDNGGAGTVSEPVTVTVLPSPPNAPPTIAITSPPDGATFTAPATITVSADAADSDDGVGAVEFWVNGTLLIGTDSTAPYIAEWSTSTPGQYRLTAIARDTAQGMLSQAVTITVKPPDAPPIGDVVVYATDVGSVHGTWSMVSDPTAAAGKKLTTPDNTVGALASPLANPENYFDVTFTASAGTRYRVWIRIHPRGDSKWNDSVFVQFSDAIDDGANPIYRIGSQNGYIVNLWPCADCQTSGWGWRRNAYWLPDTGDVRFERTGTHTIRVQVREDGAEIDQIILSPTTYAETAPGAGSGDGTIVPKPVPSAPPGAPSTPNPSDGATNAAATITLTWTASAATTYDVRFGTTNPPPSAISGLTTASHTVSGLTSGTTYFWQVVARNPAGIASGQVWAFTTAPVAVPRREIVVYASDIPQSALHGAWSFASDSSSPNGRTLLTPDAGWASTAAPLANPIDYVDVTFTADANTSYTVWFRLKALANNKFNDAVWVQFSDAFVGGAPVYPLNSASGLLVNLATDAAAKSLDNWGWQNGAYWMSQPVTVTFPTSGSHTLRIQIREDGVRLDQIVLSSVAYATAAPGSVGGDSTIVPKP
jgi:hypothetical protein